MEWLGALIVLYVLGAVIYIAVQISKYNIARKKKELEKKKTQELRDLLLFGIFKKLHTQRPTQITQVNNSYYFQQYNITQKEKTKGKSPN